jgi:hypothetical protein
MHPVPSRVLVVVLWKGLQDLMQLDAAHPERRRRRAVTQPFDSDNSNVRRTTCESESTPVLSTGSWIRTRHGQKLSTPFVFSLLNRSFSGKPLCMQPNS